MQLVNLLYSVFFISIFVLTSVSTYAGEYFDYRSGVDVPESIRKNVGKILVSAEFNDNRGRNIVYVSRYKPYSYGTVDYEDTLYARQYLWNGHQWELKWKIRDFAPNPLSWLVFHEDTFKVLDVDGDGVAETEFIYNIGYEGEDPSDLKYMLHSRDKKLAIRGSLPPPFLSRSDALEIYVKNIDPSYNDVSISIKNHASETWDDFVNDYISKYFPEDEE